MQGGSGVVVVASVVVVLVVRGVVVGVWQLEQDRGHLVREKQIQDSYLRNQLRKTKKSQKADPILMTC